MSFLTRSSLAIACAALAASVAHAHTTFETPTLKENTRILNNVAIGHACGEGTRVIGTSVVFPDGRDSTIIADGKVYDGPLSDFVSNWGPNIQPLYSRAAFNEVDEKKGPTGNVVGFWAGGGPGMPDHMVAYVPFRVNATLIAPESCAVSVRFYAAIVDVCRITGVDQLHEPGVAEFWTPSDLGTVYDSETGGHGGHDNSAPLTILRDLDANPLSAACGDGFTVEVRPSAQQLERDMPIFYQGLQIWPAL